MIAVIVRRATLPVVLGFTAAMFSVLLVLTGIAKVVSPADTARAIRAIGLRVPDQTGRVLGLLEVSVGLGAILSGRAAVFLVQGVIYGAFLGWVIVAKVKSVPLESCGCLGTPDTPPYWGHIAVDVIATISSFGLALSGPFRLFDGPPSEVTVGLFLVILGGSLSWLIIGDGARLYGVLKS